MNVCLALNPKRYVQNRSRPSLFKSANPKLWKLSEYDDRKGYGGSVPSANLLNQIFLHDYIQREPYINRSMQRVCSHLERTNRTCVKTVLRCHMQVDGDIMALDVSYKVTKYIRVAGVKFDGGTLTLMNGYGQVCGGV